MMMLTNASQGTMAAEWQRRPTRWPSTIISWILGCLMLWRVKSWRRLVIDGFEMGGIYPLNQKKMVHKIKDKKNKPPSPQRDARIRGCTELATKLDHCKKMLVNNGEPMTYEQMKVAADYIAGSLWEGSADGQPPLTPDEYGFTGIQKKEWAKKLAETGSVSCHQLESHTSIIR
eukprot:m.37979 g.37979  ORF g.37979 m.37979 type:complete len:174 (-) comp17803_c0_seq2:176-697(-)